jgi:hypothetical protein
MQLFAQRSCDVAGHATPDEVEHLQAQLDGFRANGHRLATVVEAQEYDEDDGKSSLLTSDTKPPYA